MLMLVFATLNPSSCQHVTDSFCQVYTPIVQKKGEGAITAAPDVKRRILVNERTHRDQCAAKS